MERKSWKEWLKEIKKVTVIFSDRAVVRAEKAAYVVEIVRDEWGSFISYGGCKIYLRNIAKRNKLAFGENAKKEVKGW